MSPALQLPLEFKKTLEIQVKMFKFIGLDLFTDESNSSFVKQYGRFILCNTLFLILICFQWYAIFAQNIGEFLELGFSISCAMVWTQDIAIFLLITLKKNVIREVFADIAEVWPDFDQEKEKQILFKEWLRQLNTFNRWYRRMVATGIVIALGSTLLMNVVTAISKKEDFHYLLPFTIPFKINSVSRFVAVYIIECMTSASLHVFANVSYVMLMFTLTYIVSTLLRLLQADLENFKNPRRRNERGSVADEEGDITKIVVTHQKLLRITEKLNDIFDLTIFIPICVSSYIMCFFGFSIVTASGGIEVLNNLIGLILTCFGILSLVWPGQLLIDTSKGVAEAAYRSLWYECDVKTRKYILIIITRSQRQARLSAAGFFEINLSVMTRILKATWSCITVVNQMYQNNAKV